MDRTDAIDALAGALLEAAGRANWDQLGVAARQLSPRLADLGKAGPWSPAERAALTRLRAAHERARTLVASSAAQLKTRLDDMAGNKEGWMAYALEGEFDTEQT